MKRLLLFIAWLCIAASTVYAQSSIRSNIASSLRETMQQKHNEGTKLVIRQSERKTVRGKVVKADTVYYRDVVRKYGWMEGLGDTITLATARHLPYYYRMSMKNSVGHWQHVEAMHGDSMTTDHPIGTYIIP